MARDSKGHFISVIKEIREKTYGSGIYQVGIKDDQVVTRRKIRSQITPEWQQAKKTTLKGATIFRCSLALNDVPYKGHEYYGFRIVAFSRIKSRLEKVYPAKMYKALIEFIEKCLHYRNDEFWFGHYLNYMGKIPPEIANATMKDNNSYTLLWTKRTTGGIMKQETHNLGEL